MHIKKAAIKKQINVEDGFPVEFIDARIQIEIEEGDTYEELLAELHKRLDKRFTQLFSAELDIMPQRVNEGVKWKQLGLFNEPL